MEYYRQQAGVKYAFVAKDGVSLAGSPDKLRYFRPDKNEDQYYDCFAHLARNLPAWRKQNTFSLPVINRKAMKSLQASKTFLKAFFP